MEDIKVTSPCLITSSYKEHYNSVCSYINYRINNWETAKDLSQDVFLRLIDYKQMLRPDTVKYFLFTIARNIVTDYLRRYYKKQEVNNYIYDMIPSFTNETEEKIIADDLCKTEQRILAVFPVQRRTVYALSRYEEKDTEEIANMLNLSQRTVDYHLFLGRRDMRRYMKNCI